MSHNFYKLAAHGPPSSFRLPTRGFRLFFVVSLSLFSWSNSRGFFLKMFSSFFLPLCRSCHEPVEHTRSLYSSAEGISLFCLITSVVIIINFTLTYLCGWYVFSRVYLADTPFRNKHNLYECYLERMFEIKKKHISHSSNNVMALLLLLLYAFGISYRAWRTRAPA